MFKWEVAESSKLSQGTQHFVVDTQGVVLDDRRAGYIGCEAPREINPKNNEI